MKNILAKFKTKKLIELNKFVFRKGVQLEDIKEYTRELNHKLRRLDFIPYDSDGNLVEGHKPVFKGWTVCIESSSETKKVARLETVGSSYRIYFDTADGAVVVSTEHMIDDCKYFELANLFEGNLELSN
jgi:hypothetical protein